MLRWRAPRLVFVSLLLASCGSPKPAEPAAELSLLKDRQRWRATSVSAQVERLAEGQTVDRETGEWSLQLVARRDPEGEQLTLFAVASSVEGTHAVRAFGALLGFAARPTVPTPITNVCASGSLDAAAAGDVAAGGTLTVEEYDEAAGTVSGTFRVNVCDVQELLDAKTLADGIFRNVPVSRGR